MSFLGALLQFMNTCSEYDNDFEDNSVAQNLRLFSLMVIATWLLYKTNSLITVGYESKAFE